MQNFTLGRKGLNWFLFAFILFVGSSSSYGQCADVNDEDAGTNGNQQSYCYLSTIQDLLEQGTNDGDPNSAPANIEIYETADSTNDTDPIDRDELLTNATTYFFGDSTDSSCTRVPVEVSVDAGPTPQNEITGGRDSFSISPCESAGFTAQELEDLFTADAGYELEVYDIEFGEVALAPGTTLTPGDSYFVGQVDDGSGSRCPSTRAAVGYDPLESPGPTADANQTYCEEATVADLMASGTEPNTQAIRWYRSQTSNSPLADDVELVNGEDYFAAQVVNDRNSPFPPCETASGERTRVVVTIIEGPDAGEDNTGVVCEPDVEATFPSLDAVENFYLSLLDDGVPTDGTFEPTIAQIVDAYNADEDGLGDFTVTYTIGEDSCQDSVDLTIRVIEEEPANAGTFDDISGVCAEDEPIDLTSLENNDPDATSGGTFTGEGVSNNEFDPSIGEGEYTITYTVDENSEPCTSGSDSTTFTITVNDANAGEDISDTVCSSDIEDPSSFQAQFASYLEGRDTDGTFDPALEDLYAQYQNDLASDNLPQTYDVTYTVTDGSCEDQATISVTVNPSPDAGEDGTANLESTDDPVQLFDYLGGTPDEGGTWSPGDGTFDPATDTPGTFTYTVSNSFGCEDSATVTVTVDEECAGVTAGSDNTGVVCETDVQETFPSNDEVRKFYLGLLDEGVPTDGTFNPTIQQIIDQYQADEDGLGDFTTTYTINVDGCEDSTELTVSIVAPEPANAGEDVNLTFCTGDEDQNLYIFLSEDANNDGTFEGYPDGIFSPSSEGAGTYTVTYTVDESTGCVTGSDSATFNITVNEGDADAGEDGFVELAPTDDPVDLFDFLGGTPDEGGTWSPGDGTFDPATDTAGTFTYTVSDGECTDSATVTVTLTSEECDAGSDNTGVVCDTDVQETFSSNDEVRKYYLGLLDEGVPTNGTFNPTIQQIIDQYQADEDGLGDFTTTYTINVDGCEDSADLTVRIIEEGPANAGSFDNIEDVCSDEDPIDLTSLTNNDPDATIGGTFSGEGVTDNEFDPSIGEGTYTITYSVDDTTPCTTGSDDTSFTITVIDAPVSASINRTLCVTDARDLISDPAAGFAFLQNLVEEAGVEDFDADNFNDEAFAEATRLSNFIDSPTSDSETFNFEYTDPSDSVCGDGVISIAITINDLRDAEAGDIEDQTVCEASGMIDLTDFFTDETVPGGTFSGTGVEDGMFDSSLGSNEDGYEITYTVDDSTECVTEGTSDSTTFTIFIDASVDAGESNSTSVCRAEVDELFPNNTSVRNFYLNLLDEGVSRNGTFAPTIQEIIDAYNANADQDEFSTTYTISNGTCSDSVELTINLFDAIPAEIGDIANPDPICRNADDIDLFSFLPEDANPNGTFEGYEEGTFSPGMAGVGSFEITYTLTEDSPCTEGEASATFTITVTESAFAGEDMDLSVCMSDEVQNLFDFISVDADNNGEFTLDGEVIADGLMNPADFEAGEYEVIYTVEAINDCGDDTATFTVTVEEAPDAPTVDGNPFNFCATDDATVADLSATGTNLTYYSDEALSMMVAEEDTLVAGTYYVTQRGDDGTCESEAAEITVNINDAATPTISDANPTFCEFNDPTVADLTDLINETGTITWYDSEDGDNALSSGTPLQDGVTYYATLFDTETGCESSIRLAVSVSIECDFFIPEGFSPNGDGLNDTFDIRFIEDIYPNYTMEIRNRNGDLVYKGNRNSPNWDGTSTEGSLGNGVLPVGAYFYYIDFNDGTTEPARGTVYLSR
ncbi:gliding motility-associated C-terminal domain-containing protein [Christiangramia sp.]|uniref:gliding motility-associated C-terminal domain-containing protein n=1 Tax=Christiangramia sp. TaxID=1931228 RepID=UPI00260C031A|nr:gliding motility-associated C-terminal domain-containing protein [Christiangramia sp.]